MRIPATAQITRIGTAAGLSEPDRASMQAAMRFALILSSITYRAGTLPGPATSRLEPRGVAWIGSPPSGSEVQMSRPDAATASRVTGRSLLTLANMITVAALAADWSITRSSDVLAAGRRHNRLGNRHNRIA
jgi:hypothetical protein